MKSSTTPEVSANGKKLLAFQLECNDASSLWRVLRGQKVVAYSMPDGHSFQAVWLFRLILSDGGLLEFSSACTQVADWHEVGSLNIRYASNSNEVSAGSTLAVRPVAIPALRLHSLEKLVYEDADVISECALVLHGEGGKKIVVAVGIPSGSVTVMASFSDRPFEPQFAISTCRTERLGSSSKFP